MILSLEESSDLDSTAVECLLELDTRLRAIGKELVLSRVKDPVRELLLRWAPKGLGDPARMYWSVADAAQETNRITQHGCTLLECREIGAGPAQCETDFLTLYLHRRINDVAYAFRVTHGPSIHDLDWP